MKKRFCALVFSLLTPIFTMSIFSNTAHSEPIQGFPEGCAFATMNQALPYHILGYGRIRWMGAGWAFQYLDQNVPGPFSIAAVADNLGLMAQNPEQNISMDLLALTPGDKYVVAQILDRSEMGLGPIVTCISPAFFGEIMPNRPIVFGQDYWSEYRRFRDYKWDDSRRRRWERWKYRWSDRVVDWRRKWKERRERDRDRDRDRGLDIKRLKPGLITPIKDREDSIEHGRDRIRDRDRGRDIRRPKPGLITPIKDREDPDRPAPIEPDRDRARQKPEKIHVRFPEGSDSNDGHKARRENLRTRIDIQLPDADKKSRMRPNIQNTDDDQQEGKRPAKRKR